MMRRVRIAVIVMGFSGLVAEILLLRELLIVFSGNELTIGIILANWLVLEALGCFWAGRLVDRWDKRLEAFALTTVLFSLSVIAAVFLTRNLRPMLGVPVGESIGLLPAFYSTLFILLPVSILHGALFTFSCRIYSDVSAQDSSSAGKVYVLETIGTIVGGIVCTYVLVPYVNAVQAAVGLAILNCGVCGALLSPRWRRGLLQKGMLGGVSALILLGGASLITGQVDALHRRSIQGQWKNQNIVHYQNSEYGNICVIENEGQYIYFQDGLPAIITPVPDIPFVEEFVHLPLLSHREPVDILILSGGAGGIINEALKHPSVESIEYAELDPLLLALLEQFPTPLTESELSDTRVRIRHVDGRLLLRTTPSTYDVILVGIMEPSSLQANRFFTQEFFSLARGRLNEGGIVVLAAPGSLTLLNEELRDLNSCVYHTLSSVFPHVRVMPGDGRNVFVASDSQEILAVDPLQVMERLDERGIATGGVVPWHVERKLHPGWENWFANFIEGRTDRINYDFRPLGLFYSISHWNALHAPAFGRVFRQFERISLEMVLGLLVLFLALYASSRFWSRRTESSPSGIPLSIVTTGFAGMIFSLVVIFAFQSVYGYVFSWIGLLVAAFMAGAAGGARLTTSRLGSRRSSLRLFKGIELAIVFVALGLPFVFAAVSTYVGNATALFSLRVVFLIVSFGCGSLVGSQFPLGNALYLEESGSLSRTAALLYASDLLGGWIGGIVGAVVLLPVLGVMGTCFTVGLLKLASFVVITTQPRSASVRR